MTEQETCPKVSIIMPTYNRANLIMETIKSVLDQTYTNWELIIIDDGSEDNTEYLVTQLNDKRIQFYKAGRTGRVSKMKNDAIQKARGELVAFLDSDDLWEKTKLVKQVAAMEQYPEAGFCLTGAYSFIQKNEPVHYLYKQREGIRCDNIFIPMFKSEIGGYMPTLMCRKKAVDVSGYFDETKLFSDPDFILSLACYFKGVIIFEPLLYRRLHGKNDSKENWEKGYNEWIKVLRSYRSRKQVPSAIAREAFFKLYINYGEKSLLYKRRGRAIINFFKAWSNKPFSIIPLKKTVKSIFSFLK